MNALQVFSYENNDVRITEQNGDIWFVAKDVCNILGLGNITEALRGLDDDELSSEILKSGGQGREMRLISESGLYALIFRSNKPEAKQFSRWVRKDVLPEIRQTGSYNPYHDKNYIEQRKKDLEQQKRDLDLRCAQLLQSMIDKELFPITPETRTVFAHEVFRLVTGHEYLAMLPECTEKFYTATEIGQKVGISANKVGRIAKANGLKAPEGEANEYGRWIFSKSQHSSREVPCFIYSESALDWFREFINS